MNGKGQLTAGPQRRLRWILFFHVLWVAMVCLLGAWWGSLILKQGAQIESLQMALGKGAEAREHWARTQRMLFWESLTYFSLFLGSAFILFWLYWRDAQRTRSLHAFFASVTHELRTPLTSIRLQAESLSEGIPEGSSERNLVTRLLEDTTRLEAQVERTLELARVEGGGQVFTQSLQIKPWMDRMIQSWKSTYGSRLSVKADIADVSVEADPVAIQVVLRNLLENSFRHAKKEPVEIAISIVPSQGGVEFTFRDNGDGYHGDPRNLGRLFQKGESSQGAGVGLYLVSTLMQRMGGWARFGAEQGFRVALWFREAKAHG